MATKDWKPSTFDQFYTLVTQYLDVLPAHERRHEEGRVVRETLDPDVEEVLRTEECTADVEMPLTPWDTQSQDSLPGEPCRRMGNSWMALQGVCRWVSWCTRACLSFPLLCAAWLASA